MPSKAQGTPSDWPEEVIYLTASIHSPHLNDAERDGLRLGTSSLGGVKHTRTMPSACLVRARRVQGPPDHPALGQLGLFAIIRLPPGSVVMDYLGLVHSNRDSDLTSDYDLSLDRDLGVGIDAARMGNEARFINDYRGIQDRPNVEFIERAIDGERRMSVRVMPRGKSGKGKGGIAKGEELLVNYGKGFWTHRPQESTGVENSTHGRQQLESTVLSMVIS